MRKEDKDEVTVGYNVDGSPITQEQHVDRVKATTKRVKTGDFLTQDEVEQEVVNW